MTRKDCVVVIQKGGVSILMTLYIYKDEINPLIFIHMTYRGQHSMNGQAVLGLYGMQIQTFWWCLLSDAPLTTIVIPPHTKKKLKYLNNGYIHLKIM